MLLAIDNHDSYTESVLTQHGKRISRELPRDGGRSVKAFVFAIATCAAAGTAAAQDTTLTISAPGPTAAEQIVAKTLAHRYIVRHEEDNTSLVRDSVFDTTVVVLNSDATVASTVHGDVLVVNGDLFLKPGAKIDGKAISIGGGIHGSRQATVFGEKLSFRDTHFDTVRKATAMELVYRIPPPSEDTTSNNWSPRLFGFRLPLYDRVDGVALQWGPRLQLANEQVVIDPTVTYRSNLGAYDLAAAVRATLGNGFAATATAGRATLTNDGWIQSDLGNTLSTVFGGSDFRSYWRADRFEARVAHEWLFAEGDLELSAGGRTEDDWSVRGGNTWSLSNRRDTLYMRRPNPGVERGNLSSALVGAHGSWQREHVALAAGGDVEVALDAPNKERFTQTTIYTRATFPTFATNLGTQTFVVHTHMVFTAGDTAPPQRLAYLGGSGTLPTLDILSRGGDELVFLEGQYNFPIQTVQVTSLGSPVISLHEMIGSTGIRSLGRFDSNIGARLTLGFVSGEFSVNPANGDNAFTLGLSMVR